MGTVGVVMAGGGGTRMRASGVAMPKPLVPVAGVPLLVRAVCALIRHDLTDVVVCLGPGQPEIVRLARGEAEPLVAAAGGRLDIVVESAPLGNIGGVRAVLGRADTALVVYADNLTTLDLAAVLRHHAEAGAAMTLATHDEQFRIPYGRLTVKDGEVVGYEEKPQISVQAASAVTALAPSALEQLPLDRPTGMVDLCCMLLEREARVSAYRHAAAWVDVNDAAALSRAHALLARHTAEIELWWREPARRDRTVVLGSGGLLVPDGVALATESPWAAPDGSWGFPAGAPVELDTLEQGRPVRYRVRPMLAGADVPAGWSRLADDAVTRSPLVARLLTALVG